MKSAALFLPLLLAACVVPVAVPVPNNSAPSQQIYGQWQLTALARQSIHTPQTVLSIYSVNPQFSAQTDCNQIFGHYSLQADTQAISFSNIASTRMACEKMDIERGLGQVLPQVRGYRFEGRRLKMLDDKGNVLLQGKRVK
ncbi:MAG: META domain-containing protein [Neisseria sp.]|nr:META domain-containing protein [Neisseria sp.]